MHKLFIYIDALITLVIYNLLLVISSKSLNNKSKENVKIHNNLLKGDGIDLDMTTKGLIIFVGFILFILIIVLIVYIIMKCKEVKIVDEVIVREKIIKKKEILKDSENLKQYNEKIEIVMKNLIFKQDNILIAEEKTNDELNDQSAKRLFELIDDQSKINYGVDFNKIEDIAKEIIHLKRNSVKSNNSKISANKFVKINIQNQMMHYDSERRSSPDSSFYQDDDMIKKMKNKNLKVDNNDFIDNINATSLTKNNITSEISLCSNFNKKNLESVGIYSVKGGGECESNYFGGTSEAGNNHHVLNSMMISNLKKEDRININQILEEKSYGK